ncbi:uncharacterized protein EAE97_010151 [Botrytis byssoidea]|uniref:DUF7702 domain-containing protein n=1 Tax=Botrytis byssoidea TaxID=139641 RepID=A0A9P5LNT7_9HELO|nr:uncharacterized protein EAE97_010151 [Botrytis byssoidea]KAF7926642.1 hypothetical protein EAE97_010151 [Botrytis byssoidea]
MVSTEKDIAYAEIIAYAIALPMAVFVIFSQGFKKKLGWVYIGLFSVVRIAGAMFELRSIHNPANTSDAKWSVIMQSVGLSPLFMATYGLLSRTTDIVSGYAKAGTLFEMQNGGYYKPINSTSGSLRSRFIYLMHIPTLIALALCIVGGTREFDGTSSKISSGRNLTKVGIAIYVGVLIIQISLVIITFKDYYKIPTGHGRVFWAVVIANPFLAVRLIYSVLAAFTSIKSFSVIDGSALVRLLVASIEEFTVVALYLLAGLMTPSLNT